MNTRKARRQPSVAVVGIGRWGKNLLRTFGACSRVQAVCSTGGRTNAQWLKKHYPAVRHTASIDAILRDPSLDAVIIATPIATHARLAARAIRAGKHVYVEKPLATSVSEAKMLYLLAKKHRRALFVGNVFLYHPVFQYIQQKTRRDPVCHIQAAWNKFGSFAEDILWNIAYHDIVIATALCGSPKRAALVKYADKQEAAGDIAGITLSFAKGVTAHIDINRITPEEKKTKQMTLATKTRTYFWAGSELFVSRSEHGAYRRIPVSREEPLTRQCRTFIGRISAAYAAAPEDAALNIATIQTLTRLRRYASPI